MPRIINQWGNSGAYYDRTMTVRYFVLLFDESFAFLREVPFRRSERAY